MYKVSKRFKIIGGISKEGDLKLWNLHSKKSVKGSRRTRNVTENPFTTHKLKAIEFMINDTKLYLILTA